VLVNVRDYERAARERLEAGPYGYFAGGAADEWTLRENVRAFRRWQLRPRALVDVSAATAATTVLGEEVSMPVVVAPVGFQTLAWPDGEVAAARACAEAETIYCMPTLASVTPAECAAAAGTGRRWFQLYWSSDREFTRELLVAVAESGFSALVLTVDLPVLGRRERDLRTAFDFPPPGPLPNVSPRLQPLGLGAGHVVDAILSWRDLEWLREVAPLPLVVKGVLTAEDALLAVEHGASAVVVSNHGGRQLDGVPASLDVLPEVVEAVAGRIEVYLDGGVRRGHDVLVALALGARAVLIGRPMIFALAAAGEDGVRSVLELFRSEVEVGLKLLGCPSPGDVTRAHVASATRPRGT
jgi:isopentenyl diphosphate isomerase/L-lactate dehydrogenase-like FMN-dependent dehydrogenase